MKGKFTMYSQNLTAIVSVTVAIVALISPILTTLINNHHQTELKRMELKQQEYERTIIHQRDLYEKYFKCAGRCIYYSDPDALKDYGEYYLSALIHAPSDLRGDMVTVNEYIENSDWSKALKALESLAPKIRSSLQL